MRIVVVGAGKMGYSIAKLLADGSYDVVVIEQEDETPSGSERFP